MKELPHREGRLIGFSILKVSGLQSVSLAVALPLRL
jgi:hypothetical protein